MDVGWKVHQDYLHFEILMGRLIDQNCRELQIFHVLPASDFRRRMGLGLLTRCAGASQHQTINEGVYPGENYEKGLGNCDGH